MLKSLIRSHRVLLVATLATVGVLGAAGMSQHQSAAVEVQRTYELPTQRIISIGQHLVRLDTRTGAMSILRGEASATASGQSWSQRVPA
ncbi:MAG: hypothetical protein ACYTGC_16855, partial [Planctomycetota bacterium]